MRWLCVCFYFFLQWCVQGEPFKWTPEYRGQAEKTTCLPGDHRKNVSLQHDTNQKGLSITNLGKCQDMEVCGLLCCEVESCDLALLDKNDHCFALKCNDISSCDLNNIPSNGDSEIVTFRRKSGSDIWSSGVGVSNKNNVPSFKENNTKIIKQVQKSSIPEITSIMNGNKNGAVISMSNNEHPESPMDQLLQKETSMIRDKQQKVETEKVTESAKIVADSSKKGQISDKIQDVTEHYLKAEEKSDITALQENETSSIHPKVAHRRKDLRHTLISPITIGAFTCMAVIAVSGFAMAIIKYQRERKDFEDKQTQKP